MANLPICGLFKNIPIINLIHLISFELGPFELCIQAWFFFFNFYSAGDQSHKDFTA